MVLQRRYSVAGQTPPEAHAQAHSPRLQALDTSVQTAGCGLCGGDAEAGKACCTTTSATAATTTATTCERGRNMAHTAAVRTSSKRSATQLPSPNTPSSQALPTKIARLGLEHDGMHMDEGCFTDPLPENEENDWALSSEADSTSRASSPALSSAATSLHYSPLVDPFVSDHSSLSDSNPDDDDDAMVVERLALSPPPPLSPPPLATLPTTTTTTASPNCSTISSTATTPPPTLLTLPPELRHQIYLHLPDLVLPYPLIYCLSTSANNIQHPLAAVSRTIRAEALAMFYSYNTWIIKLEFRMMYEAFQEWIIRLGNEGASALRVVVIAVRGSLFKPGGNSRGRERGGNGGGANWHGQQQQHLGQPLVVVGSNAPAVVVDPAAAAIDAYRPPDGDAKFNIDLSEKYPGGKVELVRNDGTREAGEKALQYLRKEVERLWTKRKTGTLNGQDWIDAVDGFLGFVGWW